ncbi:MFS transporter [Lacticaseibacillus hegangensis]|uniref:MFS transporter n=1 Tax=Lacticaseibacillus hegangensis TaxID=2486010 RepID=A0ABW4CXA7_9LACO|nr:MFS transporter [Lacticaseibacillus hegangensis]
MKQSIKLPLIGTITFSQLGSAILSFVLSLAVLKETKSATAFGLVVMVSSAISIVASPFLGVLVDRLNKRLVLFCSQVISIAALAAFFIYLKSGGTTNVIAVCTLNVFLELSDSLYGTALLASAVHIASDEGELTTFNSLDQSFTALCSLVGPLVAGALYQLLQVTTFVWLEMVSEALALVFVIAIPMHKKAIAMSEADEEADTSLWLGATVRYLRHQKLILLFAFGMLLLNLLFASLDVGLPYLMVRYFAGHTMMIAIIEVAVPVGLILASIIYPMINYKGKFFRPVFLAWTGFAIVLALLGLSIDLFHNSFLGFSSLLIAATLLLGVSISVGKIPLLSYFETRIPAHQQGRVFSLLDSLAQVTTPVGTVLYGVLFDHADAGLVFLVSGVLLAAAVAGIFLVGRPTLRTLVQSPVKTTPDAG